MSKVVLVFLFTCFLTLPLFAQSVDTAWVRRYNGPGNGSDVANSIVTDDSGNVYVTGKSYEVGTGFDYVTIKYYPNGDTNWVRKCNGTGDGDDFPKQIVVDGSGNVYVAGSSYDSVTKTDYTVIKYDSDGNEILLQTYDGLVRIADSFDDFRYDLWADSSRNLGWATVENGCLGLGTTEGNRFGRGSVYSVFSLSRDLTTSVDYDLQKFDDVYSSACLYILAPDSSYGMRIGRTHQFNDSHYYEASHLIDGVWQDEHFYLSNDTTGKLRIDKTGKRLGAYFWSGDSWILASSALLLTGYDSAVNVILEAGNNGDAGNAPGVEVHFDNFYAQADNITKEDCAVGIALDDSANFYVTGTSCDIDNYEDYATIKYYASGDTAWVRRYNGSKDTADAAYAIAVDNSGNAYVTGRSYCIGACEDYTTIKYYPDGDTAWVRKYNGSGDSSDAAYAMAVDSSGNVYVTGTSYGDGTYEDYATIKYFANGDVAWVRRYDGPGSGFDYAYDIAVDDSGNVYVTGESWRYVGPNTDYATIKYYSSGLTAWVKRYNGTGNGFDYAYAIAVDNSGNVYVTGTSDSSGTYKDFLTIKYYANGDIAWVKRYNGAGNSNDVAKAITIDGSGNVYVTGCSVGNGTDDDYATIKYVQFLRGDTNCNGKVSLSDIVYLISYLYKLGPAPDPIQSADTNCDGQVSLADIVYLIAYLYKLGPPPCI